MSCNHFPTSCDLYYFLLDQYHIVGTSFDSSAWFAVLDSVVILISFISLFLCIRSLINSWRLAVTVRTFFKMKFDNFRLKVQHLLPLFNGWHLMVITSNALVIVGSFLKILISYSVSLSLSLSLSLSFSPSLFLPPPF